MGGFNYNIVVNLTLNKTDSSLVKSEIPQIIPHITSDQLKSLVNSNTLFAFGLYKNLKTSDDNRY